MPIIQLNKEVWTAITTTDKTGGVFHLSGNGTVIYAETPVTPVGHTPATPTSRKTQLGDSFTYWGIEATNFLWAYAISDDASLTVTPAEI